MYLFYLNKQFKIKIVQILLKGLNLFLIFTFSA